MKDLMALKIIKLCLKKEFYQKYKDLHEYSDKKARELMEKKLVDMQEFNLDVKDFVGNCNIRIEDDYTHE